MSSSSCGTARRPDPRIEFCVPDYRSLHHFDRFGELPGLRVVQTQLAGYEGQVELLPAA